MCACVTVGRAGGVVKESSKRLILDTFLGDATLRRFVDHQISSPSLEMAWAGGYRSEDQQHSRS